MRERAGDPKGAAEACFHVGNCLLQDGDVDAALAGIREKMKYSDVPPGLRGLGITFITVGLMSLAFMSFSGIQL